MSAFNCAAVLLLCGTFTSVHGNQLLCHNLACFDTGTNQITVTLNDDDIFYVDFNNESVAWESRVPLEFYSFYTFKFAADYQYQCKLHLERWQRESVETVTAVPEVLIYSREDVKDKTDNTLICLVRNFFPPIIRVQWTKNREVVKSDNPFEKMIPGSDGTFQVISTLSFVPAHGDIYGCMVGHETLKEPVVRFFEVDFSATDIGPTVYCAICIPLGFCAFAAGIFLFFKDNQRQNTEL